MKAIKDSIRTLGPLFLISFLMGASLAAPAQARAAEGALLRDKTLVAWVYVAHTNQQGGSLLTVIDKAEHFDAIVLGEVARGRWMAGSDHFRRTRQDQANWPAESADSNTLVQLAISYRGDRVTLFRNGKEYAAYSIGQPQVFGDDAMVLLGLRYISDTGEIGFFTGALEEARIYDTALSAEQIAALKINQPSDPKPLAWWTFEDGKAEDLMKRFPASRLEGNARIADGKLVLDGSSYLWAAKEAKLLTTLAETPFDASPQTMFYKARSKQTGPMWDTWLFYHEGRYYLYYLAGPLDAFHGVALATSPDGVHWTEQGNILRKGVGAIWMGSGSVWKSCTFEKDKKFIMSFSEWRGPGGQQSILFAESTDLVHWQRLGSEYEFKQDPRWYRTDGYWDALYTIPRAGGGRYGYVCAQPKGFVGVGIAQTLDGTHWEALEPPKIEWGKYLHLSSPDNIAVSGVEKIGNHYYMMVCTSAGGAFTFVAERPQGPFRPAARNMQLLSNKNNTFPRFFPTPDAMLVNHHTWTRSGAVYFPVLKRAVVDEQAALRLKWWKGNEKLKHEAVRVEIQAATTAVAMLGNTFDTRRGLILEGRVALPASKGAARGGVYIEHGKDSGTAVLVDANGATEFGTMRQDGSSFQMDDRVDREASLPRMCRFRLLMKASLIEFYLDDQMIQCYSLAGQPTGRIGFIAGGHPEAFRSLRAWYDVNSAVSETVALPANPPATWLTYHLAHPEAMATGDPNGAFFWKGRYHLHYICINKAGVSWAHVSSEDMLHWKWHPTTLTPASMGHSMFSGTGFLTKEGRPAIIYHEEGSGRNQISMAEDDLLEKWSKPVLVEPKTKAGTLPEMRHWDPDCWLKGDTYYAVSGGRDPHLMKSSDLNSWQYLGHLLHDKMPDVGVTRDEDISCPNIFQIGDKWMLLCLSHWIGCRYYLGQFQEDKFVPESRGVMNWMNVFDGDSDLFAPESLLTPDGRRVMWAWSRVSNRLKGVPIQGSIQSLPRELSLPADGMLRIKPLRELEKLRYDARTERNITVKEDTTYRLKKISGDVLEIKAVIQPGGARQFGVQVYCDQEGNHGFPITFEPGKKTMTLGETRVPFELKAAENLELRVFLDKSIIEVFVNDRQAALAPHHYAPKNLGITLFSKGGTIVVKDVKGWKIRPT